MASNLFVVLGLFPLCYPQFFSLMDLSFESKARGAERDAFPIPSYISQSLELIPTVITTATCRIKAALNYSEKSCFSYTQLVTL